MKLNQTGDWVVEQHHCERCGKIMTEKFGSGRFYYRTCANSRICTTEIKNKIRKSVNRTILNKKRWRRN